MRWPWSRRRLVVRVVGQVAVATDAELERIRAEAAVIGALSPSWSASIDQAVFGASIPYLCGCPGTSCNHRSKPTTGRNT